ncbi:hypothetical protein YK48G_24410 [Lentilactobacillus fungorum]|uniref:CvpA family protein n=1 Tax=Lentilactobacillus fungorum TaxID=2201250 RepID=A0ABQ3W3Y2_9LACO|nr:CvpA family protein [Lentilactobacillus fungorum]GHP15016.1 hypothetical protein YK48G_24410 [Lentilactobacillus fungorum]
MILDIIVILILISGLVSGFRLGFIHQSIRAGALILALIVALYYFQPLANLVITGLKQLRWQPDIQWTYVFDLIAFIFLFSVTNAVYLGLGRYLNVAAKLPIFHVGDELLGALMGVVTHYLIVFFVLSALIVLPVSWFQTQYHESQISQMIVKKTPLISDWQSQQGWMNNAASHSNPLNYRVNGGQSHEMV